jgi:hypothetical protein
MVTGFGNATGLRLNRIAQFHHQVRRPRDELQIDLVDVTFLVIQSVLHGGSIAFSLSDPRTSGAIRPLRDFLAEHIEQSRRQSKGDTQMVFIFPFRHCLQYLSDLRFPLVIMSHVAFAAGIG